MTIYNRMQATASRVLASYRQDGTLPITLSRPGLPLLADNAWDAPADGEAIVWTLDAAVKGVSSQYVDGELITASDLEVTAAVFGDVPRPGDVLSVGGQTPTVLKVMQIPAAGTVVAWRFIVRGLDLAAAPAGGSDFGLLGLMDL